MPETYHQQLRRQINEALGADAKLPADLQKLLHHISDTYSQFDAERAQAQTTIKLRTEQLMASTSRAYSFLDSLHRGFIMCDVNPEVVLTNLSVRAMLSADEPPSPSGANREWTLAAIDTLLQPALHLKDLIRASLASNQPREFKEVSFGKRVLRLFIAPMINEVNGDQQPIGAVILVEDITEQKVLDRSKDEFFSIASHELRTPLTAIRGNASVIKKYYAESLKDPSLVEMIDDIHESSVRLIEIVNDFLNVSALEQGKIQMNPEALALADAVSEVTRELQALSDAKGLALVVDPSVPAAPLVTADKQRIKQVIYNLIGNAIKFTDQGSITATARADQNFVYCTVTDTGHGMPPESHRLLFRKFQQAGSSLLTRDNTKGTGLGLYISKLIVELSGGKIELEHSEVGKGSAFTFSLPRAASRQ
ncbi:MAG TPA: HAMP domain-containing sensor histidine kinase [Candidatus Saccharimonadia bacterium]|nr:HAMP domain-containing sensor histidine kinase [Candidatus Saccharimonadia bacterium]